jgi:hypothetical protein
MSDKRSVVFISHGRIYEPSLYFKSIVLEEERK